MSAVSVLIIVIALLCVALPALFGILRAALDAVTPAATRPRHGAAWQRRLGAPYPADTGSATPMGDIAGHRA
jgi:hypothetical protein